MIDDDDDLPVLTHILRTGNATPVSLIQREADNDRAEAHSPATVDVPPIADALVIGNDPDAGAHPGRDAFASRQDASDVDEPDPAAFGIDEPDFVEHAPLVQPIFEPGFGATLESPATTHDAKLPAVPAVLEDPAVVAARLRATVLADLLERIGPELDARIAQSLHDEVETALGRMQYNLRHRLTDALQDVVARAVADALRDGAAPVGTDEPD